MSVAAGRITADREVCMGSGMCAYIASRYFDVSQGTVDILLEMVAVGDTDEVTDAIDACPAQALRFIREAS